MTGSNLTSSRRPLGPSTSMPPTSPPSRTLWLLPAGLLLASLSLVATWFYLRDPGPQPVVQTTLETSPLMKFLSGGRNWRNLDFTLTSAEREDLALCLDLAAEVHDTTNGVSAFADPSTKTQLESVLARRPNFFYAEYLLGLWHEKTGDASRAREYYAKALEHAPVVLVQRYELPDGRPLAGARIATFQVECNRVRNGNLNPTLKLTFFDLTTDADGAIRLPVYDTVYRLFNTSHPAAHTADYPRLGWFESETRIGLLPRAAVRPDTDR